MSEMAEVNLGSAVVTLINGT